MVYFRERKKCATRWRKSKKPLSEQLRGFLFIKEFGGDLLSHTVSHAVPSALKSLTSVFGMGTGGTSSL
jgi:hypothetical protein